MATLRIWETVRAAHLPIIRLDERVTFQSVDFTAGATQSEAFDEDSSVITVSSDVACALAVGSDPTATTDSYPLAADTLFDIEVQPGEKISVIATA